MEDAVEAKWVSPSLHDHRDAVKYSSKRTCPSYNSADGKNIEIKDESANSTMNSIVAAGPKALPFEFRALEVCLESACRCLESEVCSLSIICFWHCSKYNFVI